MITFANVLELAADAINKYPQSPTKCCLIGFLNGNIACVSTKNKDTNFVKVTKLSAQQIEAGLTSPEWSALGISLYEKAKELGLCQEPQKP